ncbi:helix-turn-helix domain-containing protein [uncultured Parabacteroides sp.]|jgi:transcriptional regulator with XRE-family HTH domain|uniref:helix-turn-helix domain-containing protein n=1 Tax=uncultured Parabacteroides sp. TaxID=512312 RepID=UPI00033C017E|nr:helix-turn-helix transcriptional regulator [uncultured Parabacteroides sp.]CCX78096.1 helix-turn-helix domain-containing protein [Parabacteroides johnsonii CAG:246]
MRIKELLKEKGLTQQELADMVGVSYQSMKQTLNASSVTTSTLEKIATALNVPMWQLFASPEEVQPKKDSLSLTCPHCGKDINIKVE